jgi:hypothetical protein
VKSIGEAAEGAKNSGSRPPSATSFCKTCQAKSAPRLWPKRAYGRSPSLWAIVTASSRKRRAISAEGVAPR